MLLVTGSRVPSAVCAGCSLSLSHAIRVLQRTAALLHSVAFLIMDNLLGGLAIGILRDWLCAFRAKHVPACLAFGIGQRAEQRVRWLSCESSRECCTTMGCSLTMTLAKSVSRDLHQRAPRPCVQQAQRFRARHLRRRARTIGGDVTLGDGALRSMAPACRLGAMSFVAPGQLSCRIQAHWSSETRPMIRTSSCSGTSANRYEGSLR